MREFNLTTTLHRMGTVKKDYVYYVKTELDGKIEEIINDVSNAINDDILTKRVSDVYPDKGGVISGRENMLVGDYLLSNIDFQLERILDFETYAFILGKYEFISGMTSYYRSLLLKSRAKIAAIQEPQQVQNLKELDQLICTHSDEWLEAHCRR